MSVKSKCKAIGSVVGLLIGYFLFLFVGGMTFKLIEQGKDLTLKDSKRKHFLQVLARYNISMNSTVIKEVVLAAVQAAEVGGLVYKDYSQSTPSDWNIGSSVFFAGTIVTTIGMSDLCSYNYRYVL